MTAQDIQTEKLLTRLDAAWTALKDAYAGLPDARLTEPGVTDNWSVKDILAHVTTWEAEALTHLPTIIAGGRPPRYVRYGGIDAFNAQRTEEKRDLSLAEVLEQMEETHRLLIAFIKTVPDEQLKGETRVRRRLRLDTFSHYPIHARAIREWREKRAAE